MTKVGVKFKYVTESGRWNVKMLDKAGKATRPPFFLICGLGIPKGLQAPGWGGDGGGGIEGLHIPAGWHKTSHQRSGRGLENNPSFSELK